MAVHCDETGRWALVDLALATAGLFLLASTGGKGIDAYGATAGTLVFGTDSRTSVLDPFCRAHDVSNLFVVDASFFPSSAAVNPALTIVAQALRTADHIIATDLE